jgi:mono/diheme cytochrome c family protein
MNICKVAFLAGSLATTASSGAWAIDEAAQIELGKAEFMASCAACHGVDGKGGGPVAEVMVNKPLDLTQISKKYGSFPADDVYRIVDGRKMINPHGSRDMPLNSP